MEITQQRHSALNVMICVPQKSTSGQHLLILNIIDLNTSRTKLRSIHFVDDTSLYLDYNPSNDHTYLNYFDLAQVQTCIKVN